MVVTLVNADGTAVRLIMACVHPDAQLVWNGTSVVAAVPPATVLVQGDGTATNPIAVNATPSHLTMPTTSAPSTTGVTGASTTGTRALYVTNPTPPVLAPLPVSYPLSTEIGDLAALTLERRSPDSSQNVMAILATTSESTGGTVP
jgi:hypothetical protein